MAISSFLIHLVVLLYFSTCSSALTRPNISTDQSALLALKSHILDPSQVLSNWTSSTPVCNWIGVKCSSSHQRVVSLNISYLGLIGMLPPEVGNLSFLNYVDIQGNNFQGNLPEEMVRLRRLNYLSLTFNNFSGEVPSWFGFLPNLQYLNLANNSFTGSIPSSLFNISTLEFLDMGFNYLQGSIPEEVGNLHSLEHLTMVGNQLKGTIPPTLFNVSSLRNIALTFNSFSGNLPQNICFKLPKLQGIFLSSNQLSGPIHSTFNNCSELQILSLSINHFQGVIPREIGNLTVLNTIYLGRNNYEGEIPREMGYLVNLKLIDMSENSLTGPIPTEIGNLQKLERLTAESNGLTGEIPGSIFNISSLRILSLTDNNLTGSLPTNFGYKLQNLESLFLGGNILYGTIPESISNASNIVYLGLSNNQFSGSIPNRLGDLRLLETLSLAENYLTSDSSGEMNFLSSLTNCRSLQQLSLSFNPIKGILPSSIGNLSTSLESFWAFSCGIEGEIPSQIANLSGLSVLSFGDNNLRGSIPVAFLKLSNNLQVLSLQGNNFQGPFSNVLCTSRKLSLVNLGQNHLIGPLPECLGNMTSLRYLYLDSNNLNSTIPATVWSLKDLLELYLSSNSLIGNIAPEIGNLRVAQIIELSKNKISGNIPSTIGGLDRLMNLGLAYNELQGKIPESFGGLFSLETLDISHNNLSGEIPTSLESLSALKYFNVSFNKLAGKIPSNGSFANFTKESFMSNEAFCDGAPQLNFPPCKNSSPQGSHRKRLQITLYTLLPVASIIFTASFVFIIIKNWRRKKNISPTDSNSLPVHGRISYYQLQLATDSFSRSNLIATGSYASVYKGVLGDGAMLAIKVFNLDLEGALGSFNIECEVWRNLRHRNLVKVISACSNPDFKALVLEYMTNGSLERWLHSNDYFLDFLQRLNIMIDVACALDYLHHGHSSPIIHCDLKPSNVLLDDDLIGHVSDFGISKSFGIGENMARTRTLATIGYIAPEYGSAGIVSTACDIYSFGILLMETFSGKKPTDEMFSEYRGLKDLVRDWLQNSVDNVTDKKLMRPKDPKNELNLQCLSAIMKLALSCAANSPEERLNIEDALEELRKIKRCLIS